MKGGLHPAIVSVGFAVLLTLIASGCQAEARKETNGLPASIDVRVDQTGADLKLNVSNNTDAQIRVPAPRNAPIGEQTFRFYKKTTTGWKRLYPIPGYLAVPIAEDPGLSISAGQDVEFSISHILGAYVETPQMKFFPGEFVVQVRYAVSPFTDEAEFVQYSSAFTLGEPGLITNTEFAVLVTQPTLQGFEIQNNADVSLWLPTLCSLGSIYGSPGLLSDDGYLTLQRLTDVGTWQIIQLTRGDCNKLSEPTQVNPGQATKMDIAEKSQPALADLATGVYRWDVAFYLEKSGSGANTFLRDVRHVLSETFGYVK